MDNNYPANIQAEEQVIGSLLIDGEIISSLKLQPSDFYNQSLRDIYSAMTNLKQRGEKVNQVTVAHELANMKVLENIGGVATISRLIAQSESPLDVDSYSRIVEQCSINRQLVKSALVIEDMGRKNDPNTDAVIQKADDILLGLRKKYARLDVVFPEDRANLMTEYYTQMFNLKKTAGLPSGFFDLDKMLGGGFFPGELIILAGDSGLGKSTIAQQIAINQSSEGNVLFCSGEMTVQGLTDREIASITSTSVLDIRRGAYSQDLYDKIIGEGIGEISLRKVIYYRGVPLTVDGIKTAADQAMLRGGSLKAIVVDYLQKIESPNSKEQRYIQVGQITSSLADLAKVLDVPIILLAQLSREVEYRENKRPQKTDIYESKRIEQDADVIIFLYRIDKYYTQDDWEASYEMDGQKYGWKPFYDSEYPAGIAELIIGKQRQGGGGPPKIIKVLYDEETGHYKNLYRKHEQGKIQGI